MKKRHKNTKQINQKKNEKNIRYPPMKPTSIVLKKRMT